LVNHMDLCNAAEADPVLDALLDPQELDTRKLAHGTSPALAGNLRDRRSPSTAMPRWNAAILLRVQSSVVTPIVSRGVNGSVLAPSIDALGSGVETRVFGSRGREGGIRAGSSVKSDLQKWFLLLACRQISEM